MFSFSAFCAFLITLSFCLSVNFFFASLELLNDLRFAWFTASVPWVLLQIFHVDALSWVKLGHLLEEVFELIAVNGLSTFCLVVSFPEEICAIGSQKAVVRIVRLGAVERRSL